MNVHHYDRATGEFTRTTPARIDPLETERRHAADPHAAPAYLLPAHATAIAPPAPRAGFARVFSGDAWREIADHRGEIWFAPDGRCVVIDCLGDPSAAGFKPLAPDTKRIPVTRRALCAAALIMIRNTARAA